MSKKKVFLAAAAVIFLSAACSLWHFRHYFIGPSSAPVDARSNADFNIEDIHSSVDKDGDGIDDQTDILQGTREYIPPIQSIRASTITPAIPMTDTVSVPMWWLMPCAVPAMI